MSSVLANTTCAGPLTRKDDLRIAKCVRVQGLGGASVVVVAWMATKTGQSLSTQLDLGGTTAKTATLIELWPNSTVGNQKAVPVASGAVTVTVSEMPIFVAVGVDPVPQSGPVPPITPAPAADCEGLPVGLSCANSTSGPTGNFIMCPDGTTEECPDGGICMDHHNGTISCVADPTSPCTGKPLGLFCTDAPTQPGWPDSYVECPGVLTRYCPIETPKCSQVGTTINCGPRLI